MTRIREEEDWTVFARNRDTAERNGDLQTLICVLVARPRRYPTLSNPVSWQNWTAAYLGYTLRMKTLFRGSWNVYEKKKKKKRNRTFCGESIASPVSFPEVPSSALDVVYCCDGARRYEEFLQVVRLYQVLILLQLSVFRAPLCLHGAIYIYMYINRYIKKFLLTSFFLPLVSWASGIGPWPGWVTIVLQCYNTFGWVIQPVK